MTDTPRPPCLDYRPDHNGECLNCDEWADVHPLEQLRLAEARAADLQHDRDRYLARLHLLEAAVETMAPVAKVEALERELATATRIGDTFWAALQPLQLPALNVENPGQHVTDLITRVQELEQEKKRMLDDYELAVAAQVEELERAEQALIAHYTDHEFTPTLDQAIEGLRVEREAKKQTELRARELERELARLREDKTMAAGFIRETVLALRGELPEDWTGTLADARALLRERVEELQKYLDRGEELEREVARLRGGFAPPCERCEDGQPVNGRVVTLCEACFDHLSM